TGPALESQEDVSCSSTSSSHGRFLGTEQTVRAAPAVLADESSALSVAGDGRLARGGQPALSTVSGNCPWTATRTVQWPPRSPPVWRHLSPSSCRSGSSRRLPAPDLGPRASGRAI